MSILDKFIKIFNKKVEEIEGEDKVDKDSHIEGAAQETLIIDKTPETHISIKEGDTTKIEDKNVSRYLKALLKSQKELHKKINSIDIHPLENIDIKETKSRSPKSIKYFKNIEKKIDDQRKAINHLKKYINDVNKRRSYEGALLDEKLIDVFEGMNKTISYNYNIIKKAIEDSYNNVFVDVSSKNKDFISTLKIAFINSFANILIKLNKRDRAYIENLYKATKKAYDDSFENAIHTVSSEYDKITNTHIDSLRNVISEQKRILEETAIKQKDLITHHYNKITGKKDDLLIIFPVYGGTYEFPVGDNRIDFLDGVVYLANGKEQKLSLSLVGSDHDYIKAIKINSSESIKVKINNNGLYTVDSEIKIKHFEVYSITIQCDTASKIKIIASTSPDFDIDLDSGYNVIGSGNKTVTNAGTRVQLSSDSISCKEIDIMANLDNTGVIVVGGSNVIAESSNRVGIPLNAGDTETLKINDISKIYIDSTVDGEGVTYNYVS